MEQTIWNNIYYCEKCGRRGFVTKQKAVNLREHFAGIEDGDGVIDYVYEYSEKCKCYDLRNALTAQHRYNNGNDFDVKIFGTSDNDKVIERVRRLYK